MSKDRITVNQLIRIAEDAAWEDFEAMPDGRLLLQDHAQTLLKGEEPVSPLLWVFEMRVGMHFERPMQAIMSCGHFIRMRSAETWQTCSLRKLDPTCPGNCLYKLDYQILGAMSWRPIMPESISSYAAGSGGSYQAIHQYGGGGGGSGHAASITNTTAGGMGGQANIPYTVGGGGAGGAAPSGWAAQGLKGLAGLIGGTKI